MEKIITKFKKKEEWIPLVITLVYLVWVQAMMGIQKQHVVVISFVMIAYYSHSMGRKFVYAFMAFLIYGIIYDSMRVFPSFQYGTIHIAEPYQLEKALFGLDFQGKIVTANEYWAANTSTFLDVLTGLFYVNWVSVPLIFAGFLWRKNKMMFLRFSYVFLFLNLIGFITWYSYPAAPPWYVELHPDFVLDMSTMGNSAGLAAFDSFIGLPLFGTIYGMNANIYAAIPSLHCAYSLIVVIYGLKNLRYWNILLVFFSIGIFFSAVYLRHHYIIDVLLGIVYAFLAYFIFEWLVRHTRIKIWFEKLAEKI